jgi:hypothetical protein
LGKKGIELVLNPALIDKIQTTVDGGARVAFDVDAGQYETVAALMAIKASQTAVKVVVTVHGES